MTPGRILVVGRAGQLALSLAERGAARGVDLSLIGRPQIDLRRPDGLSAAIASSGASVVVNAAAYTAVDQAESDVAAAEEANAIGPGLLAAAAAACGARMIHVSTDYVFDGSKAAPYREDDATAPLGVYGRTKLAGEEAVRAALPGHAIIRTAWVYSPFARNFVKTMLGAAQARPELRVVDDQVGTPTSALDLAEAILVLADSWRKEPDLGVGATWHLAGTGATSWAGFAREIFRISAGLGGPSAKVVPITSAEWPTPARRPANSRLDSSRFAATFGYTAPDWKVSLAACVARILASEE